MRKSKYPICPICGLGIEAPHLGCQIPCAVCNKLIPNLNHYLADEEKKNIYRFCSKECEVAYLIEHKTMRK